MTNRKTPGWTIGRFARHVFHESTYDRVVLPAIADLQHECTEAAGRMVRIGAYWGVFKTIAICLAGDALRDRDGQTRSFGARMLLLVALVAALLMLPSLGFMIQFGERFGAGPALTSGVLLTASNIALAIPCALFLALALHPRSSVLPLSRLIPTVVITVFASAVIMSAMVAAIAPMANLTWQRFVRAQFQTQGRDATFSHGVSEMTWTELNDHIRHAPSKRAEELARAHRQGRIHLVASVFVLAALGLGLTGRWRSRAATGAAAVALLVLYVICFSHGWNDGGRPLAFWTWTANATFFTLGVGLMVSRVDWQT